MKAIINGKIVLGNELVEGKNLVFGDKIVELTDVLPKDCEVIDAKGLIVSPGLVDVHIHGRGGMDTMYGTKEALETISNSVCKTGVTSYLPTTMTMSEEKICKALDNVEKYIGTELGGAEILGAHMEGPFVNAKYKGAQDDKYIQLPNFDMIDRYKDTIKIITYAPEVDESLKFTKEVTDKTDIILSLGHSNATFEEAQEAISKGISHVTHLFNAMTGLNHREPGVVGAALMSDVSCEIIADEIHVKKDLFKFVLHNKGIDKVVLVTDSIEAGGLEDGTYDLGGQDVIVKNGCARLKNGTLAGSTIALNKATYNYYNNTDLSIAETLKLSTINPAKSIKVDNKKGSLDVGKDADIALFDEKLECKMTIVSGKIVYNTL